MIMMKKLCLILALLLALCSFAFAEEAAPALTAGDIQGLWNLEYVTAEGYMVNAKTYGLIVTLNLYEDGTSDMDFAGDVLSDMTWRIEEGHAWLTGYNADGDVELLLREDGALEITDAIGTMILTRPAEETAE